MPYAVCVEVYNYLHMGCAASDQSGVGTGKINGGGAKLAHPAGLCGICLYSLRPGHLGMHPTAAVQD